MCRGNVFTPIHAHGTTSTPVDRTSWSKIYILFLRVYAWNNEFQPQQIGLYDPLGYMVRSRGPVAGLPVWITGPDLEQEGIPTSYCTVASSSYLDLVGIPTGSGQRDLKCKCTRRFKNIDASVPAELKI